MEYSDWSALADGMAEEIFVMDAAEVMIPSNEARRRFERERATKTQQYLRLHHDAGAALIALEKLGYTVTRDAADT